MWLVWVWVCWIVFGFTGSFSPLFREHVPKPQAPMMWVWASMVGGYSVMWLHDWLHTIWPRQVTDSWETWSAARRKMGLAWRWSSLPGIVWEVLGPYSAWVIL